MRISMCHCLECQRRTGSAYGVQARFPRDQIESIEGQSTQFMRAADSGNQIRFHFCPRCGSTVYWTQESAPELVAVAVGALAEPTFPPPRHSVYESRAHAWARPPADMPMERLG